VLIQFLGDGRGGKGSAVSLFPREEKERCLKGKRGKGKSTNILLPLERRKIDPPPHKVKEEKRGGIARVTKCGRKGKRGGEGKIEGRGGIGKKKKGRKGVCFNSFPNPGRGKEAHGIPFHNVQERERRGQSSKKGRKKPFHS